MNPQMLQIAQTLGINPTILATPQGVQVLTMLAQMAQQNLMQGAAAPQVPGAMQAQPGPMPPQPMPQQGAPSAMSELGRRDPYSISMQPGA